MTTPDQPSPLHVVPSVTEQIEELRTPLDLDAAAKVVRLERQVAGLQRQLEHRIRQVAHLENEVAALRSAPAVEPEVLARAQAYERLAERPLVKLAVRSRDRLRRFGNVSSTGSRK